MASPKSFDEQYQQFVRMYRRSLALGVFCLSENKESLLMWAHYVQSHKGFVLGFDGSAPFFEMSAEQSKVHYGSRPAIKFYMQDSELRRVVLLSKSKEWECEQEWRAIKDLRLADKITEEGFRLFKYPPQLLRSITFGCRIGSEKKEELCEILRNIELSADFRCYQARISEIDFSLHFDEVDLMSF